LDADRRERAAEPQHERIDAVVVHEQVRAEPDRLDGVPGLARPAEELDELLERRRFGEETRRPTRPDRREARKGDVLPDPGDYCHAPSRTIRPVRARPSVTARPHGPRYPRIRDVSVATSQQDFAASRAGSARGRSALGASHLGPRDDLRRTRPPRVTLP